MNHSVFFAMNSLAGRSAALDWLIVFLADDFGYLLIAGVAAFILLHGVRKPAGRPHARLRHRIAELASVYLAALVSWGAVTVVKGLSVSPRPFLSLPDAVALFHYGAYESFPSGHSAFYAALAAPLFFFHPAVGALFMLGAAVVGAARAVSGVHYPADILAGLVLGWSVGTLVFAGLRALARRFRRQIDFLFENL